MKEAEALLKQLGLTEYEAKALLVLLKRGRSTADKISAIGGIPLPRVYDTMSSLSERGLISVSRTRPQTFRALDPKRLFELLKSDEERKFRERIKTIESTTSKFMKIIADLPAPIESEDNFMYIRRKTNIEKLWFDIISNAKKEVLVFGGDLSWVNKTRSFIKKMLKKGINFRVLCSKDDKNALSNMRTLSKFGIETKCNKKVKNLRGIVIDSMKLSLVGTSGKYDNTDVKLISPDAESRADFSTIIINNKIIADVFKNYFNSLWRTGKYPFKKKS